jgi:hypothetical protein
MGGTFIVHEEVASATECCSQYLKRTDHLGDTGEHGR